jgi:hypothetical protein
MANRVYKVSLIVSNKMLVTGRNSVIVGSSIVRGINNLLADSTRVIVRRQG